jgi:hypothetical protein
LLGAIGIYRIDSSARGELRETKITRLRATFLHDQELAPFLDHLIEDLNREAKREARKTEQARRLAAEADKIAEILNEDFRKISERLHEIRAASSRRGAARSQVAARAADNEPDEWTRGIETPAFWSRSHARSQTPIRSRVRRGPWRRSNRADNRTLSAIMSSIRSAATKANGGGPGGFRVTALTPSTTHAPHPRSRGTPVATTMVRCSASIACSSQLFRPSKTHGGTSAVGSAPSATACRRGASTSPSSAAMRRPSRTRRDDDARCAFASCGRVGSGQQCARFRHPSDPQSESGNGLWM